LKERVLMDVKGSEESEDLARESIAAS